MKMMKYAAVAMVLGLAMGQGLPRAATRPATTKPAATQAKAPLWPLELAYQGMPPELMPGTSDSVLKRQARSGWLNNNVYGKRLGPWELGGEIIEARQVKVDGADRVQIMFSYYGMFFGTRHTYVVTAVMSDSVKINDALGWESGMSISVKGGVILVGKADAGEPADDKVKMVDCVVTRKPVDPKKTTTKPAGR